MQALQLRIPWMETSALSLLTPDKASSNTRLSIIISKGGFLAPREDTTNSVEPVGLEEPQVQDAVAAREMQKKVKTLTDLHLGRWWRFGLFASNLRDGKE
jgi:hypothetical protein